MPTTAIALDKTPMPQSCFKGQNKIDAFYLQYLFHCGYLSSHTQKTETAISMAAMLGNAEVSVIWNREEALELADKVALSACGIPVMEDPFSLDKF